ncbi:MAG: hypothetical protein H7329_19930 [Opitutaceae bacterium]|nr:hypothetical protein [Cytophagales bacterium]
MKTKVIKTNTSELNKNTKGCMILICILVLTIAYIISFNFFIFLLVILLAWITYSYTVKIPKTSFNEPNLKSSQNRIISDRLYSILKSKTSLTDNEINQLTEKEGWEVIYSIPRKPRKAKIEICFTGFNPEDKTYLTNIAHNYGLHVTGSVTKGLTFLCCGDNPGNVKLKTAKEQSSFIITKQEFFDLIESGDLNQYL